MNTTQALNEIHARYKKALRCKDVRIAYNGTADRFFVQIPADVAPCDGWEEYWRDERFARYTTPELDVIVEKFSD